MDKKPRQSRKKEEYRLRTRLIHGSFDSARWDYDHHVVPPISSSTTYRLSSTQRGAQRFVEFAHDDAGTTSQVPIYTYDRLDEPTRALLEHSLAHAAGGVVAVGFRRGSAAMSAPL